MFSSDTCGRIMDSFWRYAPHSTSKTHLIALVAPINPTQPNHLSSGGDGSCTRGHALGSVYHQGADRSWDVQEKPVCSRELVGTIENHTCMLVYAYLHIRSYTYINIYTYVYMFMWVCLVERSIERDTSPRLFKCYVFCVLSPCYEYLYHKNCTPEN